MNYILTAILIALFLVASDCSLQTEKVQKLNGRILKDEQGNYYLVKGNVGDTIFLEQISAESVKF